MKTFNSVIGLVGVIVMAVATLKGVFDVATLGILVTISSTLLNIRLELQE